MYNYNYAYNPYNVPYFFDNYYHNAPYYAIPNDRQYLYLIDAKTIQDHLNQGKQGHCFRGYWGNREHNFILMSFNDPMLQIIENGQPGAVHKDDIQGLSYLGVQCPAPPMTPPPYPGGGGGGGGGSWPPYPGGGGGGGGGSWPPYPGGGGGLGGCIWIGGKPYCF